MYKALMIVTTLLLSLTTNAEVRVSSSTASLDPLNSTYKITGNSLNERLVTTKLEKIYTNILKTEEMFALTIHNETTKEVNCIVFVTGVLEQMKRTIAPLKDSEAVFFTKIINDQFAYGWSCY